MFNTMNTKYHDDCYDNVFVIFLKTRGIPLISYEHHVVNSLTPPNPIIPTCRMMKFFVKVKEPKLAIYLIKLINICIF